jgi:hypothetical protein
MLLNIVDRNPPGNDKLVWKLNELGSCARSSLTNAKYRQQLYASCEAKPNEFDDLIQTTWQPEDEIPRDFARAGSKEVGFWVFRTISLPALKTAWSENMSVGGCKTRYKPERAF